MSASARGNDRRLPIATSRPVGALGLAFVRESASPRVRESATEHLCLTSERYSD
jgi:hypothetical protein